MPNVHLSSCFLFILSLVAFTVTFVYFYDYFGVRTDIAERVELSVKVRMYFFASSLSLLYLWGNQVGVINTAAVDKTTTPFDVVDVDFFQKNLTWLQRVTNFNVESRELFSTFMDKIAELSRYGTDVYALTAVLLNEVVNVRYCNESNPTNVRKGNLKKILILSYMGQSLLTGYSNYEEWFSTTLEFCNIMNVAPNVQVAFQDLRAALSQENVQERAKTRQVVLLFMIVMPLSLFAISVILYTVACVLVLKELRKFTRLLLDFDHSIRMETAQPIKRDGELVDTGTLQADAGGGYSVTIIFDVVVCVFFAIIAIILFVQIWECSLISEKLGYVTTWLSESSRRRALAIEGGLWVTESIVLTGGRYTTGYTDAQASMDFTLEITKDIEQASLNLMEDTEDNPPLAGHDDELDMMNQMSQCDIDPERSTIHDMYRCSSASQLINVYTSMVHEMSVRRRSYGGKIEEDVPAQFIHLIGVHLLPLLEGIDARLMEIMKRWTREFDTKHTIFFVVLILISVMMFIVMIVGVSIMKTIYNMLLTLMRRISPIALVSDNKFMEYLMDRTTTHGSTAMSTSKSIIHHSSDGIIIVGSSVVIEFVNQSVSKMFGFTPEQLLGQNVTEVFSEEDQPKVEQQMSLMRNRQGGVTFEEHFICVTKSAGHVFCG